MRINEIDELRRRGDGAHRGCTEHGDSWVGFQHPGTDAKLGSSTGDQAIYQQNG